MKHQPWIFHKSSVETSIITQQGNQLQLKKQDLEIENQEGLSNLSQKQILLASAASAAFETAGALVDRFALTRGARALKAGVTGGGEAAIKSGAKTKDIGGEKTTVEFTNEIVSRLA